MNSKQCAKLAFGDPGFLDFLAPVTKFLKPVSAPLVKFSTDVGSALYGREFAQVASRPESQELGQNLFSVGALSGAAIGAGAVAAPLFAGVALPSLGSILSRGSSALSQLGNEVQKHLPDDILDGSDDSNPFSDSFDEDDAGPDEE
jgi:hypothetical protein